MFSVVPKPGCLNFVQRYKNYLICARGCVFFVNKREFVDKKDTSYVIISPNLYHASRRGVWFHVLYDARHTRSTFRVGDIPLSCKGNQYYYVDRAWLLISLTFVLINYSIYFLFLNHIPYYLFFLHNFCAKVQKIIEIRKKNAELM